MPVRLDAAAPGFDRRLRGAASSAAGTRARRSTLAAAEIIARRPRRGDAALIELTHRFDRIRLSPERLRIGAQEIARPRPAASRARSRR